MSHHLEDELRELFREESGRAPKLRSPSAMAARAARSAHDQIQPRMHRVRLAVSGAALVAASVILVPLLAGSFGEQKTPEAAETVPTTAAPRPSPQHSPNSATTRSGALPAPAFLRCTTSYSPQTLAQTSAFAFDGIVTSIEPLRNDVSEDGVYVGVSFKVREWYAGGDTDTVTVDMIPPGTKAFESTPPAYQTGTRLLVSGQPTSATAPHSNLVAEACSGFTRYFDVPTASTWRNAYR